MTGSPKELLPWDTAWQSISQPDNHQIGNTGSVNASTVLARYLILTKQQSELKSFDGGILHFYSHFSDPSQMLS